MRIGVVPHRPHAQHDDLRLDLDRRAGRLLGVLPSGIAVTT
jgi:hypothetical protein